MAAVATNPLPSESTGALSGRCRIFGEAVQAAGRRQGRLQELDSLRGMAALSVLLFHFSFYHDVHHQFPIQFQSGHYGVELFFVISGFVILMTMERTGNIKDFLISRVARLFPAYWCAVLLTTAVAFVLEQSDAPPFSTVLANLTMLHTLLRFPPIDLSYWTLTVELVFYTMIVLWFRFRHRKVQRIECYALAWILVVSTIRFALMLRHDTERVSPLIALPLLLYYGQFFVVGICLYRIYSGEWDRLAQITLAAACATSLFGEIPGNSNSTPVFYFSLTCGIAALVWVAIKFRPAILRNRVMLFFGSISYPLYLIHQRVGADLATLAWESHWSASIAIPLIVAGLIAIAYLMHVLFEMPGRSFLRMKLHLWAQRNVAAQA